MTRSHYNFNLNTTKGKSHVKNKLNYQDLVKHVEGYVSITDGVANIDNKQIQEACFLELGTTTADVKK